MKERFAEQGYCVLEGMFTPEECDRLTATANELVRSFDPRGLYSVFSTTSKVEERDRYFLESGDKIRFFWEKDVFDETGTLRYPKEEAINKIGHALHELSPEFRRFSSSPVLQKLMGEIGMADPLLVQSMFIFKHSRIGGEVQWHQDQTYLYSPDGAVVGLWFALEDANRENGCLWAIPGGHKGPLRKRYLRDGLTTTTQELDDSPWEEEKKVPLEVPKGSVILLHGLLPHMSETNRSPVSRHAYTLHFLDRSWRYPKENWLQR